jgi:uncharacterized protein YaeQ
MKVGRSARGSGCGFFCHHPRVALTATMFRYAVELSDVTRNVYETLEVRAALHPSEAERNMLARVLAYALEYAPGIELGRGVSTSEEPAISIRDLQGRLTAWIDVGHPAAPRLHRASKTGARVAVYAYKNVDLLVKELERETIHRKDELALWELPTSILDALEKKLERSMRFALTSSDGALYLTVGDATHEGMLVRRTLSV